MFILFQTKTAFQLKLYGFIFCLVLISGIFLYFFNKSFRNKINTYAKNHVFFLVTFCSFYLLYLVSRIFFVDSIFPILFLIEDGVFESLTTVFYLLASIFFILSLSKRNSLYINGFIGVLALACFFVGMEEISWGQRIFGIETPPTYKQINYQGELTIHNLIPKEYHPIIFLVVAIFCLIFFAFNNNSKYESLFWVHKDYLPSKKFLVIAILLPFISWYNMEHFEVILSFMFCVYSYQLLRKEKTNRSQKNTI